MVKNNERTGDRKRPSQYFSPAFPVCSAAVQSSTRLITPIPALFLHFHANLSAVILCIRPPSNSRPWGLRIPENTPDIEPGRLPVSLMRRKTFGSSRATGGHSGLFRGGGYEDTLLHTTEDYQSTRRHYLAAWPRVILSGGQLFSRPKRSRETPEINTSVLLGHDLDRFLWVQKIGTGDIGKRWKGTYWKA